MWIDDLLHSSDLTLPRETSWWPETIWRYLAESWFISSSQTQISVVWASRRSPLPSYEYGPRPFYEIGVSPFNEVGLLKLFQISSSPLETNQDSFPVLSSTGQNQPSVPMRGFINHLIIYLQSLQIGSLNMVQARTFCPRQNATLINMRGPFCLLYHNRITQLQQLVFITKSSTTPATTKSNHPNLLRIFCTNLVSLLSTNVSATWQ